MMIVQADSRKLEKHQSETLRNLNVFLLGRRITCMTVPAIVDAIHTACIEGDKLTVANYNVHSFNLSMQVPWFYNFLQNADIAHCDSIGILSAIRLMGLKLPLQYRASYSLLMPELLEHCNQNRFSVFLLGAKPEYLQSAIAQLRNQYPNLAVDGHHGYFDMSDPHQNQRVVQQINSFKPNILIVGMGMPIQESWIQKNRHQLDVNVIMPGGAIIDRMAGIVPDCPAVLSNIGLEWFYRLCREPKRLAARYLFGNPAFALHLALARTYSSSLKVQLMKPVTRKSRQRGVEPDSIDLSLENYLLETGLITSNQVEVELG
jgi:N-acetylglucosaminyldiphosphoundecaprenol N-acetyl-beta-D-mannosaminyltransferase